MAAPLELSDVERVANYIGSDTGPGDLPGLESALAAAREKITSLVRTDLEAPYPESLHLACTIKAAEYVGNQSSRYGVREVTDDAVPPSVQVMFIIEPWRRLDIGGSLP